MEMDYAGENKNGNKLRTKEKKKEGVWMTKLTS